MIVDVTCHHRFARWRWYWPLSRWIQIAHVKGCEHKAPTWTPEKQS